MRFFRRCLRCGECSMEEVNLSRFDCSECRLTWFPEELRHGRLSAYVDKAKDVKLFVEVPEGSMLVFDVGDRPTSEWVSGGVS